MDFTKVQQRRYQGQKARRLTVAVGVAFILLVGFTVLPAMRQAAIRKAAMACAEEFLVRIRDGHYDAAHAQCFKASLRREHSREELKAVLENLREKKGAIAGWTLREYASKPRGKPYEFLTFELQTGLGLAEMDLAAEQEEGAWRLRAYRLRAVGL